MRKSYELKTPDQILKMRVAGLLTAKALASVRAAIRPGVTTLELDQIAEKTIRGGGGVPNFPGTYFTLEPKSFHPAYAALKPSVHPP